MSTAKDFQIDIFIYVIDFIFASNGRKKRPSTRRGKEYSSR